MSTISHWNIYNFITMSCN